MPTCSITTPISNGSLTDFFDAAHNLQKCHPNQDRTPFPQSTIAFWAGGGRHEKSGVAVWDAVGNAVGDTMGCYGMLWGMLLGLLYGMPGGAPWGMPWGMLKGYVQHGIDDGNKWIRIQ